jgi:hypothetical protein
MVKESDVEREAETIFISDYTPLDAEFRNELERVLSSSLKVDSWDMSAKHVSFALPWLEIALIFASSTIAASILSKIGEDIYTQFKREIVKALDNRKKNRKISEDRIKALEELKAVGYKELKDTLGLKETSGLSHSILMEMLNSPADAEQILDYLFDKKRITITINANDVLLQGRVESESYEVLLEAIKNAEQMVLDAREKQKAGIEKILQDPKLYRESHSAKQTPVFQEGLWFGYYYDNMKKQWEFKGVAMYKPDPKYGNFFGISGETDRVITWRRN